MTRPGWVPGVSAWITAENVIDPRAGTANDWVLTAMYFRWS